MNALLVAILVVLAIYAVVILSRKVYNRAERNPTHGWRYYVEPYASQNNACGPPGTF